MRTLLKTGLILAAVATCFTGAANAAPTGVRVGTLTCNVASGWGFVFGSSRELYCTYHGNGHSERYVGSISKFGVDVGYQDGGVLIWGVLAPTSDMRKGALEGNYVGATASATMGIGLGANVLVGGLNKSIALQPVSIEGTQGLNIAAGIGAVNLKPSP